MVSNTAAAAAVYPIVILSVVGIGFALYRYWYSTSTSTSTSSASAENEQHQIRSPVANGTGTAESIEREVEMRAEPELERELDGDRRDDGLMEIDEAAPADPAADLDMQQPHGKEDHTLDIEFELTNPWRDDARRNEADDMTVVVIDIGSSSTRGGVCRRSQHEHQSHESDEHQQHDDHNTSYRASSASRSPLVVLPSVVGFVRSKVGSQHVNMGLAVRTPSNPSRPVFVGKDVYEVLKVQDLAVVHPLVHGRVVDWSALEALIQRYRSSHTPTHSRALAHTRSLIFNAE